MTEVADSETLDGIKESEPKKKKAKKRPSDFEITRTILQRTHERKLPYLLKNMGEDSDILFFCSKDEKEFTYGSPDIAVAIFEFVDPELKAIIDGYLSKMHGIKDECAHQLIINVRDQITELSKTKGESFEPEMEFLSNEAGTVWTVKKDLNGKEQTKDFCTAIDSLFHMQVVKTWCQSYRHLLTTDNPNYLYFPYRHPDSDTGTVVSFPSGEKSHPITQLYPHGFRNMMTRGLDVILDKFLENIPYPIITEEMIVFQDESAAVQMAHRIIAEGWQMVLVRPNAVFFPILETFLPVTGNHTL